jgi:hypothetical protein
VDFIGALLGGLDEAAGDQDSENFMALKSGTRDVAGISVPGADLLANAGGNS